MKTSLNIRQTVATILARFLPRAAPKNDANYREIALWAEGPNSSQVLAAARNAAFSGVNHPNHLSQERLNAVDEELLLWNEEFDRHQRIALRVVDPVTCLANELGTNQQNDPLSPIRSLAPLHSRIQSRD